MDSVAEIELAIITFVIISRHTHMHLPKFHLFVSIGCPAPGKTARETTEDLLVGKYKYYILWYHPSIHDLRRFMLDLLKAFLCVFSTPLLLH